MASLSLSVSDTILTNRERAGGTKGPDSQAYSRGDTTMSTSRSAGGAQTIRPNAIDVTETVPEDLAAFLEDADGTTAHLERRGDRTYLVVR